MFLQLKVMIFFHLVLISFSSMFSKYILDPMSLAESQLGSFLIKYDVSDPYIKIVDIENPDKIIFQTLSGWPFVSAGFATESRAPIVDGNYKANEWTLYETPYQNIKNVIVSSDELVFEGEVYGLVTRASYVFRLKKSARNAQLEFDLVVTPIQGKINRIFFNYWCDSRESFHGFGLQYSLWNLKGRRVPILVAEQGIGRGLQPITSVLNFVADGTGGDMFTTYAPKSLYITNQNRSVLYESSEVCHHPYISVSIEL